MSTKSWNMLSAAPECFFLRCAGNNIEQNIQIAIFSYHTFDPVGRTTNIPSSLFFTRVNILE